MGSSPNLLGFCILILLVCNVNWCESITCSCKQHERNALLNFQKAHMPKGSSSNRLKSWSGDDCCTWEGVGCSNLTCHVVSLNLGVDSLEFKEVLHPATMNDILTSTLTQLRNLKYLDLRENQLSRRSDDTPKEFNGKVMMNQLRYLNLSYTGLNGQIPHQLGNLSNLQVLDLSLNRQLYDHTGFRWVFGLRKLQSLNINDVDLHLLPTNSILELHRLSTLQELRLSQCQLSQDQFLQFMSNSTFLSTSSLKVLDLSYNILEGQIPHQLANLSNLQVLDLSYNTNLYDHTDFKWVFGLRKLQSLDISHVDLSLLPTNSILELHWLSTLKALRLSGCQLVQDQFLQFLSNSTFLSTSSLKVLDLSYNYLEGPIPYTFSNLSSLQFLSLGDNQFNSTVPSFLGTMRSLQLLDLRRNNFNCVEGGIIGLIEGLCGLKYLDLSNNSLQESLTSHPLNFSRCSKYDLGFLYLSSNHISGGLEWLGNFSSLKYISLHTNSFSGNFPESIIRLSLFKSLSLRGNQLSGTIPTSLGRLSSLRNLVLSDNNFTGTIPSTLGQLSSLISLDLSNNSFTGTIPSTLGQLSSLTSLDLSQNNFAGTIPSTLGQLSSLEILLLSDNNFTGTIPSTLGQLLSLDMSKNKLTGVLPDHIHHHWPSLRYLNLAYNHLNGSIPISLCNFQHMTIVNMKSNRFSGQIPDCSSRNITVGWEVVDLSSNSLSGHVPSFLLELPQIELLNLSNNTLKGELPITISKSLEILDLGENEFYGQIPSWHLSMLDDYLNLMILRLRSNHLDGMVPLQMCSFDKLQIIDLADNHLTGPIPKCFGNLSGMRSTIEYYEKDHFNFSKDFMSSMEAIKGIEREYTKTLQLLVNLDLSRNNFSGSIHVQLTELQGLIGLDVSHNQLTGKIPSQIGRMKSMESLDLSDNNLQGLIPQSLADLTSLSSLNLSYNKLYGPIPKSTQLSTLSTDPSIYAGNVNLCGDMLPKKCSTNHEKKPTKMVKDEEHNGNDTYEKLWFPCFVVLGTIIGFWGVIGILNVKQRWRYAYLRLGDEIADWIYARWMVKNLK